MGGRFTSQSSKEDAWNCSWEGENKTRIQSVSKSRPLYWEDLDTGHVSWSLAMADPENGILSCKCDVRQRPQNDMCDCIWRADGE